MFIMICINGCRWVLLFGCVMMQRFIVLLWCIKFLILNLDLFMLWVMMGLWYRVKQDLVVDSIDFVFLLGWFIMLWVVELIIGWIWLFMWLQVVIFIYSLLMLWLGLVSMVLMLGSVVGVFLVLVLQSVCRIMLISSVWLVFCQCDLRFLLFGLMISVVRFCMLFILFFVLRWILLSGFQ